MIIQHNLPAMNAHRQMGVNNSNISKSLEKLSSGYAINRAGDNAAGLAISEKMRGQISGLNQAATNSQDAISLIQTAEGALNETHSILQRMRQLSVQSANGTYDDTTDRANIDKEVVALKSEIDRISTSTQFNGKNLLDGSLGANAAGGTAGKAGAKLDMSDAARSAGALTITSAVSGESKVGDALSAIINGGTNSYTFTYTDDNGQTLTQEVSLTYDATTGKITSSAGTETVTAGGSAADVATALKAALDKTDMGKSFEIEVAETTTVNTNDGLNFKAKTAGAAGAKMIGASQSTSGVDSKMTASIDTITGKLLTLDLSKIDISSIKVGDTLTIGEKTVTFTADADLTAPGTSEDGMVAISAITNAATLATNLATALTKTGVKLPPTDSSTAAVSADAAAVGNTLVITFTKAISQPGSATAAAEAAAAALRTVTFTPVVGDAVTGGQVGSASPLPKTYTVDATVAASDRFESINMSNVGVYDSSVVGAKMEDNVITVDGKKFLIATMKTLENGGLEAIKAKLGDDVSVIIARELHTAADPIVPTKANVEALADRIKEVTGTNVSVGGTGLTLDFKTTPGKAGTNVEGGGITFQIGANGSKDQRVTLAVADQSAKGLGVDKISTSTLEAANKAIATIDTAINMVSGTRADLGALQNRLEHTIASLGVASENLQAAESRIRDVDMAKEMMAFTKNQILAQASQAMLAQANALPQGVLQLLK